MGRLLRLLFKNPRKVIIQMLAAAAASLAFMVMGLVRGWSSPGMPSLIASGDVELTDEDVSWISSLPPLASIFGSLFAGPCIAKLGRKKTLMLISFPYSAGFLLIGFASHKSMLYIGRIICGLMIGFTTPAAQIFIGECASPRIRGALGSFTAIFLALGILTAYVLGAFLEWNVLAWVLAVFPGFLLAAMLLMPETPAYLLSQNKEEDAKKSLQFLRGSHTDIEPEFERLKTNVLKGSSTNQQIKPRELLKGSVLKPLGLSMGLMFLQQFSGINAIIYFTVSIFEAAGSTIDKNVSTIIVGAVQLVSTVFSMFLVDRAGRRILLLASGVFMTLALASMGAFFFIKYQSTDVASVIATLGWLPLASLIVFIIAYSSGYANVPFLIMGELFPSKYRSIMGSLASSFNLACTFTIVRSFSDMRKTMGEHGAFWFYSAWCFVGLFYVYFLLPETKGKSLDEIEKLFASKKKRLTLSAAQTTINNLSMDKGVNVYTIEPVKETEKEVHDNGGFESDEDCENDEDVVTTPY